MSTSLAELTGRVGELAESLAGTEREDVAGALFEIERSLHAARRRLDRLVTEAG